MKIRLVRVDLLHSDGRTDLTKPTVYFHNFANAPKNLTQFRNFFVGRYKINYFHGTGHKVFTPELTVRFLALSCKCGKKRDGQTTTLLVLLCGSFGNAPTSGRVHQCRRNFC